MLGRRDTRRVLVGRLAGRGRRPAGCDIRVSGSGGKFNRRGGNALGGGRERAGRDRGRERGRIAGRAGGVNLIGGRGRAECYPGLAPVIGFQQGVQPGALHQVAAGGIGSGRVTHQPAIGFEHGRFDIVLVRPRADI